MARLQVGGGRMEFPNGSVVVVAVTADSDGATPPTFTNSATAYTITPGPNGAMPQGYPDAFPGATIAP